MKLSEAIRLGAMLRPQGYGDFFVLEAGGVATSCALGAACEAHGAKTNSAAEFMFDDLYPWAATSEATCPQCKRAFSVAMCVITHLNDFHLWTREQIADWVETVEPVDVSTAVAVHETAAV